MATTGRTTPGTEPAGVETPPPPTGNAAWGQALLAWGLFAGLVVVQFVLFRRHAVREVVWAYPDHYDQAFYLQQAYALYERMQAVGCWHALVEHIAAPRPQGVLFPVPAAFLFLLTGPSRLAAVTTGFAHFALFQATLVATLRWLTRRWGPAFLGLGLLLAAVTPFMANGGLFDYRIDFTACCLFGMVLCLVVRSRLFASRRWAVAVGAACAGLILARFLTMAYVAGIAGLVLVFLCLRRWRGRRDGGLRRQANRQLCGFALAGGIVLAATAPALWLAREGIYGYYVVGHVTGAEKHIRAAGANIAGTLDLVLYYPRAVAVSHLGATFGVLAAGVLGAAAVLAAVRRLARPRPEPRERLDWTGLAFFLCYCLLVPYGVLTLDEAKSDMACNVLVPPALWLVLLGAAAVARVRPGDRAPRLRTAGFAALAAAALAAGLVTQVRHYRKPSPFTEHRAAVEKVGRIFDALYVYCRETNCTTPRVAVTTIQDDYLTPTIIPAFLYERHGVLLNPCVGKLGGTLFAVTAAEALDDLRQSDFVILAAPRPVTSLYPFDECMKELYPQLKAFCDETLQPVGQFRVLSQDIRLYARPPRARPADTPPAAN